MTLCCYNVNMVKSPSYKWQKQWNCGARLPMSFQRVARCPIPEIHSNPFSNIYSHFHPGASRAHVSNTRRTPGRCTGRDHHDNRHSIPPWNLFPFPGGESISSHDARNIRAHLRKLVVSLTNRTELLCRTRTFSEFPPCNHRTQNCERTAIHRTPNRWWAVKIRTCSAW